MTSQTRRFIELADVLGLHLECKHCHTALSLPMPETTLGKRVLASCPTCQRDWIVLNGTSYEEAFKNFIESVKRLARHLDGEYAAPFGCSVRLEIKHEPDTE